MEKLPTIILPEGKKPEHSSSFLSSPRGRSGEGSEDMSPRGGDSSSVSSRSNSSTGLQQEMSGGMTYLCSNLPSRSGSSHLLAAPVPAAAAAACAATGGGMPPAPPAEAVPSLVRLASIRLRACKPPLLAEDFYIRRIGMQLLHPSLPPALLRGFARSSSSLASRRSPGQQSPATSRSSSSCKRMLLHSSNNSRSDVNSGMNSNSGGVASTSRNSDGGGGDEGTSNTVVTGTSSCSGSDSKRREWTQASSSGCEPREGSDVSMDWPTAAAGRQQQQPAEERRSMRGGGGGGGRGDRQKEEEGSTRLQQADMASGKGGATAAFGGAGRDTAATTDKREAEEAATTEKAREEWEAEVREKETDYFSSVAPPGETTEAASPVQWQRKKLGSDSSDTYERVQKIGSLRLEEEKERRWALDKKKESPYCVGCCGDVACAKPVAPSRSSAAAAAARRLPCPTAKSSPETLGCLYKQGHHELVLEITPPLLQPGEADITPKPYHHLHSDVFSRLSFSVSDVNAAQVSLSSHMIRTGAAAQFADVNFAVTCLDLEDFRLRLLQRLSEYNFVRRDGMQQQRHRRTLSRLGSEECPPLGSRPLFHHVELRVRDPAASLAFYQQVLQFRLISKQAVPDFRLTLYFLTTDSTAVPPQQAELDSHANRSWLWEQSFSSICLKAYDDMGRRAQLRSYEELEPQECGFLGFTLICKQMNEQELLASLTAAAVPFSKGRDSFYAAADVYHIRDPDGVPLRILICDDACGI